MNLFAYCCLANHNNLLAQNNTHLLSRNFIDQKFGTTQLKFLSRVSSDNNKGISKVFSLSGVAEEVICFQTISGFPQNSVYKVCRIKASISLMYVPLHLQLRNGMLNSPHISNLSDFHSAFSWGESLLLKAQVSTLSPA